MNGTDGHPFTTRIVERFLKTNLSVVLIVLALLAGIVALYITPREEEPQIVVPVADVYVHFPGASAQEVENLVATRLEKLLWQIDGVEYVYSMSKPDLAIVTVRFYVGEHREHSIIKLYNKIEQNIDLVPPGVAGWVVKPIEVDDVPIVNLTFHSDELDDHALRRVAEEVIDRLQGVKNTGRTSLVGGRPRQIQVKIDINKLAAHQLSPLDIEQVIRAANLTLPSGAFEAGNREILIRGGSFFSSSDEVANLVVGVFDGKPVHLRDVAEVADSMEEPSTYTRLNFGPAYRYKGIDDKNVLSKEYQAVTLAIAKRRGTNAVWVAHEILNEVENLKGVVIPSNVDVLVTRNYGETANDKVNELVEALIMAIASVIVLIGFFLGWRGTIPIAIAVPVTYSLTLLLNHLFGYTINRVTLFALILSLGILVDDPITDVENIYRHFQMRLRPPHESVLAAVSEVRPILIMTTIAVIVAFLPMSFITGMMGPYMRPMALNVPITVIMSTIAAFSITPWASYHVLKRTYGKMEEKPFDLHASIRYRIYRRILSIFLKSRGRSFLLVAAVVFLWAMSTCLPFLHLVPLKMLPFDNKNELQVVIDLPEGTTLEGTDKVVRAFEDYLKTVPEVTDFESYVGCASPMDFNGMVRHYYLRGGSNLADIRINLVDKRRRKQQSHAICLRLRTDLEAIANSYNARLKIVEVPPGPPVISTLVAEIYGQPGHTYNDLLDVAKVVRERMEKEYRVVDVDDTIEAEQHEFSFITDKRKAALSGINTADIARTLKTVLGGEAVGTVHITSERHPLNILVRLPRSERSSINDLKQIYMRGNDENLVQLGELGIFRSGTLDKTVYHKNLKPVVYVFGEMAGRSPVEAILDLQSHFKKNPVPAGFNIIWSGEGEWKITVDVFRDLGIAYATALVGIYILLVAQSGSYLMPLIIMLAIPFTLIGIMPGFCLLNLIGSQEVGGFDNPIFFTATAMIGMIALAGIVLRNSGLLIDFIQNALKEGKPLKDALIESGAVRLRPIMLTAGTTLLGNVVITLDPIFSGLAWAIIFGLFASTTFTLIVIPVVYWLVYGGASNDRISSKKIAATP
jgi:multidrug efflux pump subunit AcrB